MKILIIKDQSYLETCIVSYKFSIIIIWKLEVMFLMVALVLFFWDNEMDEIKVIYKNNTNLCFTSFASTCILVKRYLNSSTFINTLFYHYLTFYHIILSIYHIIFSWSLCVSVHIHLYKCSHNIFLFIK